MFASDHQLVSVSLSTRLSRLQGIGGTYVGNFVLILLRNGLLRQQSGELEKTACEAALQE